VTEFGDLGLPLLPTEVYLAHSTLTKLSRELELELWDGQKPLPVERVPMLLRFPDRGRSSDLGRSFRLPAAGEAAIHLTRYHGADIDRAVKILVALMASRDKAIDRKAD
jgi:hypothetical protein